MARLRILIKLQSADAYELKAQALNNTPRFASAGISAFKFSGDENYIADGEFSPDLPAPETASVKPEASPATDGRLRVVIRMLNADSYELKARALNNDPRLKEAGISTLKFVGEQQYLADGEFSTKLPPPLAPEIEVEKTSSDSKLGKRLRVLLRMANTDAYELKAQALNNDPRLKETGISALKFTGEMQYIAAGDVSADVPAPATPKPAPTPGKKLRVVLRSPPDGVYDLIARHLNGDPALAAAGIAGMGLAKGAGMVPMVKEIPQQPAPTPAPVHVPAPLKKKRSFAGCLVAMLVAGFLGVTGASALYFLPGILNPPAAPTATQAAVLPITGPFTPTYTSIPPTAILVLPTTTKPTSTKPPLPSATITEPPTVQVASCQAPTLGTIIPGSANCRYGPGESYAYEYGLYQGDQVPILGKVDTAFGTWVQVQTESEFNISCWVNANLVEMDGEVACLESVDSENWGRPLYNPGFFPPPTNVEASRSENLVFIAWTGYELAVGDWEGGDRPRYLLELWTCQGGNMVFTPLGTLEEFASITDEGGCSEESHGRVYMAHVDGYIGPSEIPWP
jgi:hypothetical protein